MADSDLRIGRLAGTDLVLDLTWFVVAFGVASSTWTSVNRKGPGYALTAGISAMLMFVGALVLHEIAHLAVGRFRGDRPTSVTFWGFGGWTTEATAGTADAADTAETAGPTTGHTAPGPGVEALRAMAGPVASALIGMVLLLVARSIPVGHIHHAFQVAGRINLLIAMVNVVPAYRCDAYELVHAAAWRVMGDRERAWRVATRIGQVSGVLLAAAALLPNLTMGVVSAIVIVFVGLWQTGAATSALRERPGTDPA